MTVILITGAGRGIGAHLARNLSAEGHRVFAGCRRPDRGHELGGLVESDRVRALALDVTRQDQVDKAIEAVLAEAGRLDVLVNNAGTATLAPVELQSDKTLRATMETNFFGTLRVSRAVLPAMRHQGGGKIINLSSLAAFHGLPAESAYCASKSALEAASQAMALEVERFGITVTTIRPGYTATGMATSDVASDVPRKGDYEPLLRHLESLYVEAAQSAESPDLVLAAVRSVLANAKPEPLIELGRLAPAVAALREGSAADQHEGMVDVHAMDWWRSGLPEPNPRPGA